MPSNYDDTEIDEEAYSHREDDFGETVTFFATPDQAEVLALMEDWLLGICPDEGCPQAGTRHVCNPGYDPSDWAFLLEGYAGTGKSFCITELAKNGPFKPSEICFTAPTNKAVKVLRNYLDGAGLQACTSATIYSLLGLSLQANGEIKEIAKPDEPVDLSHFKCIVVDEGSMINRFLMDAIEEASATWSVPFIFMGDPAQLPPIGESKSPIFKIEHKFTLTKVLRYGNSMLDLATRIRNLVDHPFPSIKIESDPPVYRLGKADWFNAIESNLALIKSGDAKIIAWRNITTEKYNQWIRGLIFGKAEAKSSPWLPGDAIVATTMLKDLDDNTIMRTDEEAVIEAVATGNHPRYSEYEIFNLLVRHEDGRKLTLRVLTPTGNFHLNNRLNELSAEAKSGKRYLWREFWKLKEAFHEIKWSYAITSHRSQGSSYLKVFIDLEDILLNRNRAEAFRSLYVSCTRQREELYIS